ncbi:hypothetical protein C8R43DRAFT_1235156 [Mycena crocata]|nr:hypothetical protein C8R43DRAFT_1235156 [Mycena crocata]
MDAKAVELLQRLEQVSKEDYDAYDEILTDIDDLDVEIAVHPWTEYLFHLLRAMDHKIDPPTQDVDIFAIGPRRAYLVDKWERLTTKPVENAKSESSQADGLGNSIQLPSEMVAAIASNHIPSSRQTPGKKWREETNFLLNFSLVTKNWNFVATDMLYGRCVRLDTPLSVVHLCRTLARDKPVSLASPTPRTLHIVEGASIANDKSIVIDQLVALNGLDTGCTLLQDHAGSPLCLPQQCKLYTVQTNDTCDSIGITFGLTYSQILSLNFQLDIACRTLPDHVNSTICVGLSAYTLPTPTQYPVTTATVAAPTVTGIPVAPNTDPSECGEWHVVVGGDTCNQLSLNYQISLADLYLLNPMLNANCTNLLLGFAYCVEGFNVSFPDSPSNTLVGPSSWPTPTDSTYVDPKLAPGTATDWFSCSDAVFLFNVTLAELQFWNPSLKPDCDAALQLDETVYCVGDGPPLNVAPGTITSGCSTYYVPVSGDSCSSIEAAYNLTLGNFISMNPEINAACDNLALAVAYCVASSNSTIGGPPDNVAPGTITSGCTEYHTVISGDSCSTIETRFSLTLSQFISMNPEIDSNCFNLALDEAYCVKSSNATIPSNVAPGTITSGCTQYYTVVSGDSCGGIETQFSLTVAQFNSMNPEIDRELNGTIPANVAPGTITAGCTQYYTVVSGDSCSAIETKFSISSTQFIAMNPEIDVKCTTLALDEAYCVQTSNSTTTGPPSNLAAGSLANCTSYHTVVSGDSCQSMEIAASISASDFFRWNPEVKTDCTNIFAEDAYCVGGGGQACGKLYVVKSGDECGTIAGGAGITVARLHALNPQVDASCDNLQVGDILCVG